jgi:sodium bicarbonate transporter 10
VFSENVACLCPHYVILCLQPTRDDRGWLVSPWSDKNPWWLNIAAVIPALLAVILIFMDQQITAVIVNRKENKLKVS